MARESSVTKLSKSILEMKFMKKTKEKVQKELEDAEGREMYSHEITEEMKKSGVKCFIYENSYIPFEDLLVGRLSFRGMNPEIERLMELEKEEADQLSGKSKEMEVTDAEMAAHYNPLVNTMDKKFNKKRFRDQSAGENIKEDDKRKRVAETKEEATGEQTSRDNTKRKQPPGKKFGYGAKKRFKVDDNCDSPSVQHKDKKSKFMKPSDV